jgi:ribokinase
MNRVVVVGSCNLDFIVEVPTLPVPGETVLGADVVSRPGGKGANQAVAARRLGADAVFVGATGADQFAATLREALSAEGLDLRHLATADSPTGVALIVIDASATNQITVAAGANRRLSAAHLTALGDVLEPASVLLLQLEIPVRTCVVAATAARDAGATVVLNAAPVTQRADDHDLNALLDLTDVLIVNENEAMSLGAQSVTDAEGWLAFAAAFSARRSLAVVVTLGADGAVAAEDGSAFAIPAYRIDAIDSTGAGDAFCGAVAAAVAEKRPLREAVERGCAAGALATTAVGAQAALPRVADIEQLLSPSPGGRHR